MVFPTCLKNIKLLLHILKSAEQNTAEKFEKRPSHTLNQRYNLIIQLQSMPFEGQVIIVEGKDGEYLVSSQQGSASVHVILRLKDVDHLVRVEFEHALHFLLFQGFLASLTGLLVQLLSAFLVLPDPSQIPVYKSKDEHDEREQGHVESDSLLNNIDIKGTVPINVTLFILSKRKWITITIKKQI